MRRSLFPLLLAIAVFSPTLADAQFGGGGNPFTVAIDPAAPHSNSSVRLTPISGEIDITTATMTVVADGREVYAGNAQPVFVRVGEAGRRVAIAITMRVAGAAYTEEFSVTPQDVAIVLEPLSSAPPFYAGKPLVPMGGSVRVVAVADLRTRSGARIDPRTLGYAWSVDGAQAIESSGVGEWAMIADAPLPYRSRTIAVTVTAPDGSQKGSASIEIAAAEPTMRIYEHDPLAGIRFDRALGSSFDISGSEATLYAAPFSFPTALRAPTIEWYVGGTLMETGNLITLRPTGAGRGTTGISVRGIAGSAAGASADLTVNFGASGGGGFFGL